MVDTLQDGIRGLIDAWAAGFDRDVTRIGVGNVYFVPSDSEGPDAFYIVAHVGRMDSGVTSSGWVCSCKAFRFNRTGAETCKHILRVKDGLDGAVAAPKRKRSGKPSKSTIVSTSKRKTATPRNVRSTGSSAKRKKRASTGRSSGTKASAKSAHSPAKSPVTRKRTSASPEGR